MVDVLNGGKVGKEVVNEDDEENSTYKEEVKDEESSLISSNLISDEKEDGDEKVLYSIKEMMPNTKVRLKTLNQ